MVTIVNATTPLGDKMPRGPRLWPDQDGGATVSHHEAKPAKKAPAKKAPVKKAAPAKKAPAKKK